MLVDSVPDTVRRVVRQRQPCPTTMAARMPYEQLTPHRVDEQLKLAVRILALLNVNGIGLEADVVTRSFKT